VGTSLDDGHLHPCEANITDEDSASIDLGWRIPAHRRAAENPALALGDERWIIGRGDLPRALYELAIVGATPRDTGVDDFARERLHPLERNLPLIGCRPAQDLAGGRTEFQEGQISGTYAARISRRLITASITELLRCGR
jgi:hypothetical protein